MVNGLSGLILVWPFSFHTFLFLLYNLIKHANYPTLGWLWQTTLAPF